MAITNKPWDGSAGRWPDAASYCHACLINENTGDSKNWTKDACHLPVREPGGDINSNGVHAAAARLMQTKTSPANKKAAARKLRGLYRELKETPPDSLKNMGS
jgi:hypothetical protein